jgi:hypothetical protein
LAANGDTPSRERTVDAGMLDQVSNVPYLDVINEIAEGLQRRMSLPSLIDKPRLLRRLIIHALIVRGCDLSTIACILNVSKRTIERERLINI